MLARHDQTEPQPSGCNAPTEYAVYQWFSRNEIPDRWQALLSSV
jgi:hypothetical protein